MKKIPVASIGVGIAVLLVGGGAMVLLWGPDLLRVLHLPQDMPVVSRVLQIFHGPPAEAKKEDPEKTIRVEVRAVQLEDVPVVMTGYGAVHAFKAVQIAPEVSGKITETHPQLVAGGIIAEGDTLFAIDPRSFETQVADARALLAQQERGIERLRAEWDNARRQLETLEQKLALDQGQLERLQKLQEEGIASAIDVDQANQAYLTTLNQRDEVGRGLDVYPIRIGEMQAALESAQANLDMAQMNLERTRVVAPFDARVRSVDIEQDQFVTAGNQVLELVDDSVLEVSVPLDSRDARQWLRFDDTKPLPGTAWFAELDHVSCKIQWTEESDDHTWEGTLNRVEAFDPDSRTLTLAVRIEGEQALSKDPVRFPLVDGMFCRIEIPGRTMRDVYRVAQSAVSFENTVFISVENRLKTVPVEVARVQDEVVFVGGGLNPGDLVVTTRLVNPLENSLLEIQNLSQETAQ